MKVQVLHDKRGNILSFALASKGSTGGLILQKANHSTREIDVEEIEGEVNDERTLKRLMQTFRQHKVDLSSKQGKLIRKSASR